MKRPIALSFLFVFVSFVLLVSCRNDGTEPVPETFEEEVEYLIDSSFAYGGVAVGVINGTEEFTIFQGTKSRQSNDPPDENSVYEMGSITKTFTGIVLAEVVLDGTIQLEDEIQPHLPDDRVTVPTYGGMPISFLHLATHTSGLATNFSDNYPLPEGTPHEDPFALIREEHIYDYLSNYAVLYTEPGTTYRYSNFGYGLLGFVLGKITNDSFGNLVQSVMLDELGMTRTSFALTSEQLGNIAVGHTRDYDEVEPWSSDHDLVGCGGLKSTLRDMMVYLKANMGILPTQLGDAMEISQQIFFDTYVGLGWQKTQLTDGQVVTWFAGASAGHLTFIAFNREYNTGVVVLYNVGQNMTPVDVGKEILVIAGRY